jgi:hypothetical protein
MPINTKDLQPTFTNDFIILINQFSKYIQNVVEKSAGPRPAGGGSRKDDRIRTTVTLSLNAAGDAANTGLFSFWRKYIVPLNQKASPDGVSTFSKTSDITTWNSYFFVLRTQLLGAVGGNPDDPIIKEMDSVWSNIILISGNWVVRTITNK